MGKPAASQTQDSIQWFKMICAFLAIVALAFLYTFIKQPVAADAAVKPLAPAQKLTQLCLDTVPSLVAVLVGFIVFYWFIYKKEPRGASGVVMPCKSDKFLNNVSEDICKTLDIKTNNSYVMIDEFYECYRQINWPRYIKEASHNIDIVVYYYDSWIKQYFDDLVAYFKKPNTKMRIFLSNPTVKENMAHICRSFPDHTEQELLDKVSGTKGKMLKVLERAGAPQSRLEVYYYPGVLGYPAHCFDDKVLILGFFEMFRDSRIDSPAIAIDLNQAPSLHHYWSKEIKGLEKESIPQR